MNDENIRIAFLMEAEARIIDLELSLETVREQRDKARASVDLLLHENARLEEQLIAARARIDRLTLHIQQGIEL